MADEVVNVTVEADEPVDPELEKHAVELPNSGKPAKFVPLGTLVNERKENGVLKGRLAALEKENAELRPVREKLADAAPAIRAMQARPDLMEHALKGTSPSTREEQPAGDKEAEAYAKDLELFDTQGRPDTARARRILDRNKADVAAAVQKEVAPLRATTQHDKAEFHRNWAAGYVKSGQVSQEAFDAFVATVPDAIMADPKSAQAALMMAMGQTTFTGKGKPMPREDSPEVFETETPGRRETSPTSQLSPAMRAVLTARGVSTAKFAEWEKKQNGRDVSRGVTLGE